MSKKQETPLEEIRRVRKSLDKELAKNPNFVRDTVKDIERKYGIHSVKSISSSSQKRSAR